MHILYLHQYFVPPEGSGGTRSYEMARRFVKFGHTVTMITSSAFFPKQTAFSQKTIEMDIEGISLWIINVPYSNNLSFTKRMYAFFLFALKSSLAVLKAKHVDVVFATSTPLTIAIPGVAAKLKHKCPMVFEVRDLWPELPVAVGALRNPISKWLAYRLEKWAYKNSDHIIALSPGMKNGIIRTGYHAEKVTVVPNSCDRALFGVPASAGDSFLKEHPYLEGLPLVTYAGTLGMINGVGYLVDIAAKMLHIDSSVRFLIVGAGMQASSIYTHARSSGVLEKNLWIIPPVAKQDMPRLLSATTVAVSLVIDLPALWNNSANKFFDALAAGRPVAINHEGWQADILRSSGAGIVLPPCDAERAAQALNSFLKDNGRLERAQDASTRLAETQFSRDRLAEQLCRTLEKVVDDKICKV
ncbi:glycosyltransferase family 4 protein [uncultured Candidatus Kuenenia sp.]|uniref:glycosyltransferase family 4 protein n=1 Tax=uncultured Candidatus Kuenenia sp. TaxID=1048336 RepID=UPI0025D6F099|nr:glycosyltransferase family 4 protein [uncultured Candidatus Kuenenia sp.]